MNQGHAFGNDVQGVSRRSWRTFEFSGPEAREVDWVRQGESLPGAIGGCGLVPEKYKWSLVVASEGVVHRSISRSAPIQVMQTLLQEFPFCPTVIFRLKAVTRYSRSARIWQWVA